MTTQLIIAETGIKQDPEGRYCLNDLHKAAGSNPNHAPAQWMRHDSFHHLEQSLIHESYCADSHIYPVESKRGRNGGTFVVKELVYAYAMWISPAFHLKVIRAYDTLQTQGVAAACDAMIEDILKGAAEITIVKPEQSATMALPTDYLSALEALVSSVRENQKLQADNRLMHDELNLITIDEYRALTHRYFPHSFKVALGHRGITPSLPFFSSPGEFSGQIFEVA